MQANDKIHMGIDHRLDVLWQHSRSMHRKNAPRDTNSDKQRRNRMQNIRTQTGEKKGDKEASTFEERYQELEEKNQTKSCSRTIRSETTW